MATQDRIADGKNTSRTALCFLWTISLAVTPISIAYSRIKQWAVATKGGNPEVAAEGFSPTIGRGRSHHIASVSNIAPGTLNMQ
jgi:hypothetical protein